MGILGVEVVVLFPLPLLVFAAAFDVSDDGVKGHVVVVGLVVVVVGEGEGGAELEAAGVAVVRGSVWGVRDEEEEKKSNRDVYDHGDPNHCCSSSSL